LMVSQVLTLYTTPVIYLYMNKVKVTFSRRKQVTAIPGQVPPTGASI
jgi:hypothetical protein